jgi:acyl-CoA synthetase (AMP-forming)/AMP-acid ligase II
MLGSLLTRNLRYRPDAPAVVFEGRTITHRELAERAFRLARALHRRGVRRGDRVAILAQNCPEYMETYAAGEIGGWITVPINYRLAPPEAAYILSHCRPKALILESQLGERIGDDARKSLDHILAFGGPSPDLDYERALAAEEPVPPETPVGPDDIAYLIYTSGTTGRPKGVMHSHRGQMHAAQLSALEALVTPTDRFALTMPLYHIGAKNLWLMHALHGCPIILHRAFRPPAFAESVRTYQATATLLAPTMLRDLLDLCTDEAAALPSLTKILYSAAPMPEPLLRRAIAAFGPIFMQVYGMTESGGPGCTLHAHQHRLEGPERLTSRLRSAGQPMIGCEVRIARPDGSTCADEEIGEILIRSPAIMTGYWNDHAATIAAVTDGWLHTGDLGRSDDEGFVFVVDRLKEMIVSGGENIYSREVEEALASHPAVREAAVVGGPDERWGEVVVAFVVMQPDQDVGADAILEHCRHLIAPYKRPRDVRFVEFLPKLPNGKIEKFKLRESLWAGRERMI